MSSTRYDEGRNYDFADRALALRKRIGLTQRELAALLDVSTKSIQVWEGGLAFPGSEHLKLLISLYLDHGVFSAGRELDEAMALWESVRLNATRRTVPFDPAWFASLRAVPAAARPLAPAAKATQWDDWSEAPNTEIFYGRVEELATLSRWLLTDNCRVVGVLGMGGIGKTLLAARLAREVAPQFTVVYWRSLRNAPPVEEWLAGAIVALSSAQVIPPEGLTPKLRLALTLLQAQRGLLVLDNFETVLEPGAPEARYREGYAGYGEVIRQLGQSLHRGCLLVTGREAPPELPLLAGERAAVRTLRLGGLGPETGRALLQSKRLEGDDVAWKALMTNYSGNPLALSVVGETIGVVFGGNIMAFLAQETAVFGGIRQVLDEQLGRLSAFERLVGSWLAVEREPVGFADSVADLGPGVARGAVIEAVEALQRRSLLERGSHGTFTLQPVVLEYATRRLIESVAGQILAGESRRLVSQALLKATAKDYVRRSQERLIAQPLLAGLGSSLGGSAEVERKLLAVLDTWRGKAAEAQGYGPGNVINLLRLLRGDLRGIDLSRLSIRQAYLQEVVMQDASLVDAQMSETMLGDAFAAVASLAVSANATYVAAGTIGGELRVWQVNDRTLVVGVRGHAGGVIGVAFSADGSLLASGSMDGTVRLWEIPSGRPVATLQGHTSGVYCVALSADGCLLAGGSRDGTIQLWEVSSGRPLATLQAHTGLVSGLAFSADGLLVSSGYDGTIRLWDAGSRSHLGILEGHTDGIWGVALSANGRLLASGSFDGTVRLWEVPSGHPLATLHGATNGVWGVALSANGQLVASGSRDGTVWRWEAPSGRPLATLQGHTGLVSSLAFSADGQLLASGSHDGTVRLWDAGIGRPLATLHGYTTGVWDVALTSDGRLLASGSMDCTVRLWEVSSGQLMATLQGHIGGVTSVAFSGDGRLLASGSMDRTVRLWEVPSGRPLATLQSHSGGVWGEGSSLAFSEDGLLLASCGGQNGTVRLWEVPSGSPLATLQGHTALVGSLAFSANGLLVSGSRDGTARLWDAGSGRQLAILVGHTDGIWGVAFSADGRLVASSSMDRTVRLWEAPSGRPLAILEGHTGGVWGVALSGDGLLLASGSFDSTVRLWETSSGRPLATLKGHTGVVYGVVLSVDGRLVASASFDGTARLWETGSGACLRTFRADGRHERLDITGLTGVTEAQRAALITLGAVEPREGSGDGR